MQQQPQQQHHQGHDSGDTTAFGDGVDKQTMDTATANHILTPPKSKPLIVSFVLLSGLMILYGIVGIFIVKFYYLPLFYQSVKFNNEVGKIVDYFSCIPSEIEWDNCDTLCKDGSNTNRIVQILHKKPNHNCSKFIHQRLQCIQDVRVCFFTEHTRDDSICFQKYNNSEMYSPCVIDKRYSIRQFPLFFVVNDANNIDYKSLLVTKEC